MSEDDAPKDAPEDPARGERIAKWLARAGVASRRDAERMIAEGRVRFGGRVVETPATFVRPADHVSVDGKPVAAPERTRLFRYHKPEGLVTTHRDPEGRPTVFDHLPHGLPPVPESATPWQELYRSTVGQLDSGAVMEMAVKYRGVAKKTPRHNH